jgi:large subunit ribosomal protein L25
MATIELTAQPRTIVGKEVKKLRRQGLVPAVVYGPGVQGTHPISVPAKEVERAYTRLGKSALLQLRVAGGPSRSVLIHQVQYDNTHRHLTHVDFLAPDMRAELTVAVPVAIVGEAPAVRDEDAILVQGATELQVSALPDQIPGALTVDVSELTEVGTQIAASDIPLPEGVTLAAQPDEIVVSVTQAQLVTEEEEPTAEEAEEAEAAGAANVETTDEGGPTAGETGSDTPQTDEQ